MFEPGSATRRKATHEQEKKKQQHQQQQQAQEEQQSRRIDNMRKEASDNSEDSSPSSSTMISIVRITKRSSFWFKLGGVLFSLIILFTINTSMMPAHWQAADLEFNLHFYDPSSTNPMFDIPDTSSSTNATSTLAAIATSKDNVASNTHQDDYNADANYNSIDDHQLNESQTLLLNETAEEDFYDENATWMERLPPWQKKAMLKNIILEEPRPEPLSKLNTSDPSDPSDHSNQQVIILTGPTHTNTKEMQNLFWKWTALNTTKNYTEPILPEWVWPVPLPVVHAEHVEMETGGWTPADIYYAILDGMKKYVIRQRMRNGNWSLGGGVPTFPSRLLFQKYSYAKILKMFSFTLNEYWNMGYNMILGSEGFTLIISYPEVGDEMMKRISTELIPSNNIPANQITAVVLYRTPKIDQFLSSWAEVNYEISFHDWITFGMTMMFSMLDALGMVKMIIENTEWKIALLDLKGLEQQNWDTSNYIACHLMKNVPCDENGIVGFESEKDKYPAEQEPVEAENTNNNTMPQEALQSMQNVFLSLDCNYKELIDNNVDSGRMTLHHPVGLEETWKRCESIEKDDIPDLDEVRERIIKIVKKYRRAFRKVKR